MPLPNDSTMSLLGSSRPGETSQSRPKQAMTIRMSEKTLDLLESNSQLYFEFSDNPGIYIGDTFFPVTSVQETSPHDLYLRTSSAAKRNAPLKLYANVTGRFTVERQLDDRITDKVRASTVDALKERAGRTTIFVDTPPDHLIPNNKKRKEHPSSMFRKPVRPSDQPRRSAPSGSTATGAPPRGTSPTLPPTQKSKEALQALRTRMIRCIAITERTSEQVVKLVGGNDCSTSTRRDILDLLEEIAEPIPVPNNSKVPKTYRLKTRSWLELRPYELPGLTDSERTNIARAAKLALRDLKIPESDPAWSHVQYRNTNGTVSSSNASGKQSTDGATSRAGQGPEAPKRGITSAAAKEKKTKTRNDTTEVMMKNESLKASARNVPPKPSASRPRPGSGFKAKQLTPTESRDSANGRSSSTNGKSAVPELSSSQDKDIPSSSSRRPPTTSSQPPERKPVAVSSQRIEKPHGSDTERSDRAKDREWEKTQKSREKEREDRERGRRDREKERDRDRRELDREKERARRRETEFESDRDRDRARKIRDKARLYERPQEREEGERSDDSLRPPKRKKGNRGDEDYRDSSSRTTHKKRKVESPPPRVPKVRDLSLPMKPDVDLAQRAKTIKEPSPLPPLPKIKKENATLNTPSVPPTKAPSTTSNPISNSKSKAGTKLRRKSPVFTSSEDEGEVRPVVKREAPATTIPAPLANQARPHASKPLPNDHAVLRARYNASYSDYLDTFQKLMKEKTKIHKMLLKNGDKMSAGSITDSDGDVELLDPDELRRLTSDYNRLHEELGGIRRILSGNGRTGSGSE